jgi:hypothetical protein
MGFFVKVCSGEDPGFSSGAMAGAVCFNYHLSASSHCDRSDQLGQLALTFSPRTFPKIGIRLLPGS